MILTPWDFTVKTGSLVWKRLRKCMLGYMEALEEPVAIPGWAREGRGESI